MNKRQSLSVDKTVSDSREDQYDNQWVQIPMVIQKKLTNNNFSKRESRVLQKISFLEKFNMAVKNLVEFPFGLPGFESLLKFAIVELKDYSPFHLMQSLEKPNISMLIINPEVLKINGLIKISPDIHKKLHIRNVRDMCLYVILRIDEKSHTFIANIRAPLVINTKKNIGHQIILEDKKIPINYPLTM